MRRWEICEFDGSAIICPTRELRLRLVCEYCGVGLLYHHFTAFKNSRYPRYHVDVHLKCPLCGNFKTFGVEINEEEYRKLRMSRWNNVVFEDPIPVSRRCGLLVGEVEETIVAEALKRWGYW